MKKIFIIITGILIIILITVGIYKNISIQKALVLPSNQKIEIVTKKSPITNNPLLIDHIVIIMMENKSYNEIVGSAYAPYINSLIRKYSFADNYFAISNPSLPNYIVLIGGSTFNITNDCTDCFIDSFNLIDQLENVSKTWKAYMEDMPSSCFIGNSGKYAQKHNPFIYFNNIRNNPKRCQNIVPYTIFQSDIKTIVTTPNIAFISPNLCNDMHDCPVNTGDNWLAKNVPDILNSPAFTKKKSLLVITWDEGEKSGDNQVLTIFIGNTVKQGFISHVRYTHYSLLKTIENVWNISPLTTNVSNSITMYDMLQTKNE